MSVSLSVTLTRVGDADAGTLRNLLQLYLHDVSAFAPIVSPHGELSADGLYAYAGLDRYWSETDRCAHLIRADGKLAGFALVNTWSPSGEPVDAAVAEFFVIRKYRRHGVATAAAAALLTRRPGRRWEVAVAADNAPAQAFWRRALAPFDPIEVQGDGQRWRGPIFRFASRQRAEASATQR